MYVKIEYIITKYFNIKKIKIKKCKLITNMPMLHYLCITPIIYMGF